MLSLHRECCVDSPCVTRDVKIGLTMKRLVVAYQQHNRWSNRSPSASSVSCLKPWPRSLNALDYGDVLRLNHLKCASVFPLNQTAVTFESITAIGMSFKQSSQCFDVANVLSHMSYSGSQTVFLIMYPLCKICFQATYPFRGTHRGTCIPC